MSGGFEVDPERLRDAADRFRATGVDLSSSLGRLGAAPDAGRSTGELTQALAKLSSSAQGLVEALGETADRLAATAADYDTTDVRVRTSFDALIEDWSVVD